MATFTGTALSLHLEATLQNLKEKNSNWHGPTYVMSFTSSPREATSVAMRILTKPLLNSSRAWIRSHCSLNTTQVKHTVPHQSLNTALHNTSETHSTTSVTEYNTSETRSTTSVTEYNTSQTHSTTTVTEHKSNTQYYSSYWIQHKSNTQYYSSNWTQVKHTVLQQ